MATLADRINRSLRLLGQLASGSTPSTSEYADALVAANGMIGSWRNEKLMVYSRQDESVTMVATQSSYTIGPGGNLNTTRPVKIESAYVVVGTQSYPDIRIIEDDEYFAIPNKTATAEWPNRINYRPTNTTGTLYVYPVPSAASALHILTWVPVATFAAITDTFALPPGWDDAFDYNLAVRLAGEYPGSLTQEVLQIARETKAALKSINIRPIKAYTELPALLNRPVSNILTGP